MTPALVGLVAFAGLLGLIYLLVVKDLAREALVGAWGMMGLCCLWLTARWLSS